MRLIYHPHARAELVEAATYYQSRLPGLGAQLHDEANRTVFKDPEGATPVANN